MADKTIAVLNIGSQTVTLAEFDVKNKALTLKNIATESVLADPSNDPIRNTQVKSAVQRLVAELKLEKKVVHYAISGQSVFTRFVKLPGLTEDNIEQLVSFEAQQHIPYPINEVAWDWELVDDSSVEKEVAVVAVKRDILNGIDDLVLESGLVSGSVDSAPIALTNSFFHSYPDSSEPTLIIDFGAKSTNLIYIHNDRVFIRSINISGVAVTSNISKEYNIDFTEAERVKVETGRVAINGAYIQQWDEATGVLATVISNAISRFPSDIARTTSFFVSQHSGAAPTKVLLAGLGSSLPYFKEFIEEKLSVSVEYFNPLQKVNLAGNVSAESLSTTAHSLGEVVGVAVKASGVEKLSIDLIPDSIQNSREETRKRPYFAGAVAAFVLGAGVWAGAQTHFANVSEEKLAEVASKATKLKPFEKQLSSLDKKREQLDKINDEYCDLVESRYRSVTHLDELRGYFDSEVIWLDRIVDVANYKPSSKSIDESGSPYVSLDFDTISYGGTAVKAFAKSAAKKAPANTINAVIVKGYWRDNPAGQQVVYKVIDKIKAATSSSFFFKVGDVNLDDSQILEVQSTLPESEFKAPFTMVLPLKQPIQISQ